MGLLKYFKYDVVILLIGLTVAFFYGGAAALTTTAMLIALEMVFSFDNAAVNAKYLVKLSHTWRMIFLTVGVLVAVVGMRFLFPFVIVCTAGKISPTEAWTLALEKGSVDTPGTYAYILQHAHPMIAAFGGMFLLMLFLDFLFDEEKDTHWLSWIEKPLAKAGDVGALSVLVSVLSLIGITEFLAPADEKYSVLFAGVLGLAVYLASTAFSDYMEAKQEEKEEDLEGTSKLLTGKAAFSMFLFLEIMDASFSFDGVIGSFAITSDVIIIAIGLGIGALFVRSMTIYLVEKGTLQEFRFMEHGAHWAIGSLATLLLLTIKFDIPDLVIGLIGIVLITASIISSKKANKKDALEENNDAKELNNTETDKELETVE